MLGQNKVLLNDHIIWRNPPRARQTLGTTSEHTDRGDPPCHRILVPVRTGCTNQNKPPVLFTVENLLAVTEHRFSPQVHWYKTALRVSLGSGTTQRSKELRLWCQTNWVSSLSSSTFGPVTVIISGISILA